MTRITALMDDRPSGRKGLTAEHGLSLYICCRGCRVLFDCGSGENTLGNAYALGMDLGGLDAVVLSHSHYDHAAGYRALTERGLGSGTVYTGPHFFEPKYSKSGIRYTDLSAGFDRTFLQKHGIVHREVTDVTLLAPGIWLIGGFPRTHDFETIPDRYVRLTPDGFRADDFSDEICMALEIPGGLAVAVGCAHPGIVNMVSHVGRVLGKPIRAVFGGAHLAGAESGRIAATVRYMTELGVEILGLGHCSGEEAEEAAQSCGTVQVCHLRPGDSVFLDG